MFLSKITVTNFKNYEFQEFVFSERLNCVMGLNGVGKTNILDAIYYLCMCKSYFAGQDKNVVKQGENFFRLDGTFIKKERSEHIVFKVQPSKKKEILKNESPYEKIIDHVGQYPIVMIAPDDTQLAQEGSEARRRFLDNSLSQIDDVYLSNLLIYNRLIDQRNTALKQFAQKNTFQATLIESYNRQLIPLGEYIFEQRKKFFEEFFPIFEEFFKFISNKSDAVYLSYNSKLADQNFEALLQNALPRDKILQRTSVGIHKDDLIFGIKNLPVKKFASQGQLKSFILALKLAQFEILKKAKQVAPILLLDDIFDKLDETRIRQLLHLLHQQGFGQIFITDTHLERIKLIISDLNYNSKLFQIENLDNLLSVKNL